ncbi:MAG: type III restriction-modification system endonuclease [Lachnospiraceae bacterium]|nr:type III restriction-modification system endonuclease [Lachnospiraceae bacterium]
MELILERNLEHQQKAVDAIIDVFEGVTITPPTIAYQNPTFAYNDMRISENIRNLQKDIREDYRHNANMDTGNYLNVDIKMETGTGKTYVYTQAMYELHKRYSFNKFIIVVPSLPIKSGTKQFIEDKYVRHHFADACGYNCEIELGVLESPKKKKKGFLAMPAPVRDYVTGSCQNTNRIYVLLVNMQLLTNGNMLTRSDYDYLVEGFYRPFDALRETKPIVIIDEPHRFNRDQKAYQVVASELQPQMIIRFGATFPEITVGSGRNKRTIKDYNHLIYELNACDSFNQNLIKGVAKEHFEPLSKKMEKVKIVSIMAKTSANFQLRKQDESPKTVTLGEGDSLAVLSPAFDGICITAVGKNFIELSNGQIKYQGEEFNTDIYSSSYQEQMIKLAIQRHFETERQNFSGRQFKIKTLALFFIDDISSYRESADGKVPYLKETFERLLAEKLTEMIADLPAEENEYREYLKASLDNIAGCHAGYFAQDNSDSDESIAKEVADILRNKKGLLSFVNEDGSYNVRRFLFSKWTLKEGWDNPNVFTITKLRSSGSENSKLQEVGRGLRLPVDENGNRISNEEFQLNYIVDFTEADFAQRLVDEINGELPEIMKIDPNDLDRVAKARDVDSSTLFIDLLTKHYVDPRMNICTEHRNEFFSEYPEFETGVKGGKVTDRNKKESGTIRIRKAVYSELRELWEAINRKYYLFYERDLEGEIPSALLDILSEHDTFARTTASSHRDEVAVNSSIGRMELRESSGVTYTVNHPLKYNEFLRRISAQTCIPITVIHTAMCKLAESKELEDNIINEYSVAQIVSKFRDWKISHTQTRFRYAKSQQTVAETSLTYKDGQPREVLNQGVVGIKLQEGTPSEKYLYDTIAFDSPLEKENIMTDIAEVVVYGKIPRSSIAIPTIVDENYSPDFMYVVKKADGTKELNIVVETKLVEDRSTLRGKEEAKIKCAEMFFNQLNIPQ